MIFVYPALKPYVRGFIRNLIIFYLVIKLFEFGLLAKIHYYLSKIYKPKETLFAKLRFLFSKLYLFLFVSKLCIPWLKFLFPELFWLCWVLNFIHVICQTFEFVRILYNSAIQFMDTLLLTNTKQIPKTAPTWNKIKISAFSVM